MTKSVRKASAWSSREVQSDPSGYTGEQEAERADERAERDEEVRGLWRWLASRFDARRLVFLRTSPAFTPP